MRSLVLLTGASRGFGQSLCLELLKKIQGDVTLYLLSRSKAGLTETAAQADQIWKARKTTTALQVHSVSIDLGDLDHLDETMSHIWTDAAQGAYTRGLLFHNAGSLGELDFTQNWSSLAALRKYNDFNLTSMMWITKRFVHVFGEKRGVKSSADSTSTIVNVSSLCAVQGFRCMDMYCSGKAARDMHMSVVAKEQSDSGKLVTLNYSPGPMDTEMQRVLRETESYDETQRELFQLMKAEGKLVDPGHSAELCVDLVLSGKYSSGDHVDYYDLVGSTRDSLN